MSKGQNEEDKNASTYPKEPWERAPFCRSSGSDKPPWTTLSQTAPIPTTTTHCCYNWSSFLHSTYHHLTYFTSTVYCLCLQLECKPHEDRSLYLPYASNSRNSIVICCLNKWIHGVSLPPHKSFNWKHFTPVFFIDNILVIVVTNSEGLSASCAIWNEQVNN